MKGLIFDIKHYAVHDGPGIRQTVFFKGCPLSCWWCHNPESQMYDIEYYTRENKLEGKTFRKTQSIGYSITPDNLMETIKGDTIFYEDSEGGVTFSGGEPLMQPKFLKLIKKIKWEKKTLIAVKMNGSMQNLNHLDSKLKSEIKKITCL